MIKTKKIKAGSYEVLDAASGQKIGEIHKTGTHLDNYPWDWYMERGIPFRGLRSQGVSDTMAAAKDQMAWAYGEDV